MSANERRPHEGSAAEAAGPATTITATPDNRPQAGLYQVMPPLTAEEYEALRDDIAAHGVRVPIDVDQHGHILADEGATVTITGRLATLTGLPLRRAER